MTFKTAFLPLPIISVDAQGTARSGAFDDVYFSADGGAEESEHVFLRGNDLPARFQGSSDFTIGELGFGTGLNFRVAKDAFLKANSSGRLHYLSVEKFPLSKEQLRSIGATELVEHYPDRLPGLHRIHFGRVMLTLAFGDVAGLLPQLSTRVDAWFLDGFAPAKNPEMWSDDVLRQIARLSAPGASFATFTAAGAVKRGLEAQDFAVEKVEGFGKKREMLVGKFTSEGAAAPSLKLTPRSPSATHDSSTAIVIGAGIAGCTVARALAERGVKVALHERGELAGGASGNAAAVLYPQLTKHYTTAAQWHFTGYGLARRMLKRAASGMLKIGKDAEDEARLREIMRSLLLDTDIAHWIEAEEASEKLGVALQQGGVWFPQGMWVNPKRWCRELVQHENITLREQSAVEKIEPGALTIIATAQETSRLLPHITMPIGISTGQVSMMNGLPLKAILCHKGYAIPGGMIGATYDHDDISCTVTEQNHAENITTLQRYLPGNYQVTGGRTSLRATTPDRLPYVGQVEENTWVSVGHGSRGMISAPLAAEVIASQICGEPLPVTQELLQAAHPLRRHQKASSAVSENPSRRKTGS